MGVGESGREQVQFLSGERVFLRPVEARVGWEEPDAILLKFGTGSIATERSEAETDGDGL